MKKLLIHSVLILTTLLVFMGCQPQWYNNTKQQISLQTKTQKTPKKKKPSANIPTTKKSGQTDQKTDHLSIKGSSEWPSFGNNLWQDRFASDISINANTIKHLSLNTKTLLPHAYGGNEAYPLEKQGVVYVTNSKAGVIAIKVDNGKIQWSYQPEIHPDPGIPEINRGIAIGNKRLFVLTPDDQLVALTMAGQLDYKVTVADQHKGIFESMAPLYANGKLFVGSSGGDQGIRGFISAYSANNGKKLWQFYTIPARGKGWVPKDGNHGGGAVWTTPTFDTIHHTLFFGTGNPSPDFFGKVRPGPNPYTDAVVAVDEQTGQLKWYQQEVPHDLWDYDVASPPVIFPLKDKLIVGEAGKDGFWYEWDRETGKAITKPVAFVKQQHTPPTTKGVWEWPGPDGGANYGPSAYNPMTKMVYVAGIDGPEKLYSGEQNHTGHTNDKGTAQTAAPKSKWKGTITAIHVETGRIAWQIHTNSPPIGGVTTNKGGLVFFGQMNGELMALSANTGHVLWKTDTHMPIGSAPIVYQYHNKTYLSVVTGGAKSLLGMYPWHGQDTLLTYSLK